jgi:membrane fusion protein (multidrug efflux system)|uniref:Efflux RND transporter periplasmic adaptor subunit n=1 Tax=candidate division WOR-3 bacterium TaxID=2052148 RepID=A0A7C3UX57_UNCW3
MLNRKETILFFLLLLLFQCAKREGKREEVLPTVMVVPVKLDKVVRTLTLFGTISGEEQVTVFSKITGRVTEIKKPEGSVVQEGEAIVYVLNDIPGMDYKPGPVPSPISGVVGKVYVEVGQTVGPQTPIANVANYSEWVKVKAPISDQDLRFVKKNSRAIVTLTAYPDRTFEGKVTNISPILDPFTRTATVEVTLPNPERKLLPGMACAIKLVLEEKDGVIALPLNAVFLEGEKRVFVVENETAHLRKVEVGLIGDELVEISSGLKAGEKVITIGKERVKDGGKVRVVEGK